MMKKHSLLLVTALSLLLLSACGAPAAPSESHAASGAASNDYAAPAQSAPAADMTPGGNGGQGDMTSGESYLVIDENLAQETSEESMLTFSLKVDTAAYTNVARYLESGSLPPKDAVRTEEMLNYFTYDGDMPFAGNDPFSIRAEVGPSPFNEDAYMAFVRVKSRDVDRSDLPSSNLTFLIDTSGSMNSYDKLPLLKEAFSLLVETLEENDRVSIVTYAGSSAVVLDGATGAEKRRILSAIDDLEAGGSTAGADGIRTAYSLAEENFLEGGNNRVILATDGDFNVGLSDTDDLADFVGERRGNGVYMSILGFGTGNIRDDIMETLSREGNGNYAYISDLGEAEKVLVEELSANLFTVADDVKAQVEFNPENVKSYRLVGYENRMLRNEDFADDSKDAGEIGAGTDVVMMFELELYNSEREDGRKYAAPENENGSPDFRDELFEVRVRYKDPGDSESQLLAVPAFFADVEERGSTDYRFASAVAAFGHLLRGSEYAGDVTLRDVKALAEDGMGEDEAGYRSDFLKLLDQYERIR